MSGPHFIGVDVGSTSARAAITDSTGHILKTATNPIQIWNDQADYYEQSSDNIWEACCMAIKEVTAGMDPGTVKGIGFDATCSLVILETDFKPLSVSPSGLPHRNVMMWMDHRAGDQTARINATKHPVLTYMGGNMSVEMEIPKMLWIKENLPSTWSRVGHAFDLPDYLTWRATGSLTRSLCSLVCKWNYQCVDGKSYWPDDYLKLVGLEELISNDHAIVGNVGLPPGTPCGSGLTSEAADQLQLCPGTAVATSIIDAHCGTLGCLSSRVPGKENVALQNRMVMIGGTSSCQMMSSIDAKFVPGVWGPFNSAVIPGMWSNSPGQSAAGKLIDYVIETHPAYRDLAEQAKSTGRHPHAELNAILEKLKGPSGRHFTFLTKRLHIYTDFHGNRSPIGDANLRGMMSGLTLGRGLEDLAVLYLATVQALAYSVRHILEVMTSSGHEIKAITACGGLSKNRLYIQTHADVTGMPISLPDEPESVLLGGSVLGACAAGFYPSVEVALSTINAPADVIKPNKSTKSFHDKKYHVFRAMLDHQRHYDVIMNFGS